MLALGLRLVSFSCSPRGDRSTVFKQYVLPDSFALLVRNTRHFQATMTKAVLLFFNALTSRIGGSPKNLLYSRLNWLMLS